MATQQRVLVTGGAGFIGSYIVADLLARGAFVRVLDDFSSGSADNLSPAGPNLEVVRGRVEKISDVMDAMDDIDLVSHQAARLEITDSIRDPIRDLEVNTVGTLNVLEASRRRSVRKIVFASSACVYGQARDDLEKENHSTVPNWPYGVSKLAAEHYARLYSEYYGLQTIGLRYGIVFGPREWFGRVLTVFLKRAAELKPPVIFGVGSQTRDFVYAEDVAKAANMCLLRQSLGTDVFNVSSGVATSVERLANMIHEMFRTPAPIFEQVVPGEESHLVEGRIRIPAELERMVLSNGAISAAVGWRPTTDLETGLRKEYDWLRSNPGRWTSGYRI